MMKMRWMCRAAIVLALCLLVNNCIDFFSVLAQEDVVFSRKDDTVSQGDATVSEGNIVYMPLESEMLQMNQMAETINSDGGGVNMPLTLNEYISKRDGGTNTFYISTCDEFVAVQELCKEESVDNFEGITLIIATPTGSDTGIHELASDERFIGIGTEEHPFKGTMTCAYNAETGGVLLQMKTPLFACLGDGAEVYELRMECNGGSAIIAENISGTVNIHNMVLSGELANADGEAGIIAANIANGSSITLTSVRTDKAVTVSGVDAGGIAGTAGANVSVNLGEGVALGSASEPVVVTGTGSVGGHFGSISGGYEWNLADEGKLFTTIIGDGADCYAGKFAGKLLSADGSLSELNISGGNSLAVKVSGTGNGGGLVGFSGENTQIKAPTGGFTIIGEVSMTGGNTGGLVGVLENTSMEIADYTISANLSGAQTGGIAGEIRGGRYIIKNPTISGTLEGTTAAGGLAGNVDSAAVELQGTINISSTPTGGEGGMLGQVVATQDTGLIYFAEIGTAGSENLTAPAGINEIGTYGGVYRNQAVGNKKLIGDGTLGQVGVINNTITQNDAGEYQLASVADFETLAIALGTDGKYGMINANGVAVFNGASTYTNLLAATYTVTNSVDISYEQTGIIALNRNDKEDAEHAFSGTMKGTDSSITITQNISEYQERVGVFSTLGGNACFEKLTFAGKIENATGVGGIAYQSIGTGLTLKEITMQRELVNNNVEGALGGVMAQEIGTEDFELTVSDITLASDITAGAALNSSGFITTVDNVTLDMKDIKLGGSFAAVQADANVTMGGFLGRIWTDVGGTITGITVPDSAAYSTNCVFGAMWYRVSTEKGERLTLDTVKLANLTVVAANGKNNCALLISNGRGVVLDLIDYDTTGCSVTMKTINSLNFDEVVGLTRGNTNLDQHGGIISIHSTEKDFPEYHYENSASYYLTNGTPVDAADIRNAQTTYFYDVFQRFEKEDGTPEVIMDDNTLSSANELLLLDVIHYADDGNVRSYFKRYMDNAVTMSWVSNKAHTFDLEGTIDLSGTSFYPFIKGGGTYVGSNNAVIIFDAKGLAEKGIIETKKTVHYGMHAGLFYGQESKLTIGEITMKGSVANLGAQSGALVCGTGVGAGITLTNITLNDLWVDGYTGDGGVGLLISNIGDTSASFDGIHMINYPKTSTTKAASALIGSAGSEEADSLILNFHDMVIADDKDTLPDGIQSHNGNVLAHASFIYNYNYTNDASINEGYGLYLFSEADDTAGNVTYGEELDYDTEFSDNSNKVFAESEPNPATIYKPYIYQVKKIEVNPKSGDILKGCGTYEDPYIIENAKQFLTLYRYMNETGTAGNYQYQTFYQNWKVIKPGSDSTFCSTKHNVVVGENNALSGDGVADVRTFGAEGFPTPDEMSRAYYRLGADIDLSEEMSTTYEQIAKDFVGFGTENRPFVGVWYGKGTDDVIHTVTLPNKTIAEPYETYGFIQYAKGAVVKDMIIKTSGTDAEAVDMDITARINAAAGGVIACILGGDNIIDNVVVKADLAVADANAIIGGYVGNVKKGGLILRNVSGVALKDFRIDQSLVTTGSVELLGAVVGKVEDGYVIYEGSGDSVNVLWTGKGGNTVYEQVSNYSILNGSALEVERTNLSINKTDANITINIPTANALQVMSMALNADALNVRPSDYENYTICGYTEESRSRKADYSAIGCTDATTADYVNAAKYDNVMNYTQNGYTNANTAYAYPYLYKYMGITGETYGNYLVDVSGQGYTVLNTRIVINGTNYVTQWNLAENGTYDMSAFGMSFRGLGALYGTGIEYGGSFHGNFDGNNSTINIDMNRKLLGTDKDNVGVARAGLFNVLYARDASLYQVSADFKDIDASDANVMNCAEIKDFTLTGRIFVNTNGSSNKFDVGGIAAQLNPGDTRFIFSGITLQGFRATGYGSSTSEPGLNGVQNVGGMVGMLGINSTVSIQDCQVIGTEADKVLVYGATVGGLVANTDATTLKITNCTVEHMDLEAAVDNAGGFIGWVSSSTTNTIVEGTEAENCSVTSSEVIGYERSGGLIGGAQSSISIAYGSVSDINVSSYRQVGGFVGSTEVATDQGDFTSKIKNVAAENIVITEKTEKDSLRNGLGGIVGYNLQTLTIEGASVSGTKEDGVYKSTIHSAVDENRGNLNGVGGIVGTHYGRVLTLTDCEVDCVSLITDQSASGTTKLGVGGIVGVVQRSMKLDGEISATNLSIVAPLGSEVKASDVTAGGAFGCVIATGMSEMNGSISEAKNGSIVGYSNGDYYQGLTVVGNSVTGRVAGGLIGYITSPNAQVRLTGISVTNGSVDSDEMAGGVAGRANGCWYYFALGDAATNYISGMTISGRQAGGVVGEMYMRARLSISSVVLENNSIVGIQKAEGTEYSAGGIIGNFITNDISNWSLSDLTLTENTIVCEVEADTLDDGEIDMLAVGGLFGRLDDNTHTDIEHALCHNFDLDADNKIGVRKKDTGDVKLIRKTDAGYQLSNLILPTSDGVTKDYEVLEQLTQDYGYYVGNMVGVVQSDNVHFYMLRSEDTNNKFATPVMTANPPVTDVGRTSGQNINDYRQYCHIVYGAEVSVAKVSNNNLSDMKAEVDKTASIYTGEEGFAILQEYRLSEEDIELFELAYHGPGEYTPVGTDITFNFPILVYKPEYGTLQDFMETMMNVMTNVAGDSATDLPNYFSISSWLKQYNGSIAQVDGNPALVRSISIKRENGKTLYTSPKYDGIYNESWVSYTELFSGYGDVANQKNMKEFKLSVFVEEPILYNVHMKLMEGKVTDVNTIKTEGIDESVGQVIMANDSDYTMLLEYSYGKVRKNMPDETYVDKVFSLEANNEAKNITVGTKLMLIDVFNGNKAYYYTVESDNISEVPFTDFKDSAGNPYENTSINQIPDIVDDGQSYYTDLGGHQLTETGVERFLLTVLATENTDNMVYKIHAGIAIDDPDLASRVYAMEDHSEDVSLTVTAVPGLDISFTGRGTDTDIEGAVSKEEGLDINAGISLKAKDAIYWVEKNKSADGTPMIDSSNNGKYLELAFYLRDKSGNRVRFPVGTNFSYRLGTGNYSESKVVPNDSVVYYYKDIRDAFEIAGSEYQIANLTQDTTIDVAFRLDFSGADLANITEESYVAWLDLLRTANKDYPMGNGNKLDSYSESVNASAVQGMGFAIRATDLSQLAINTYPVAQEENVINYNVMFDFSDLLQQTTGVGKNAVLEKWAGYDYTVVYQVYRKTENGESVVYEPYTGNDIVLSATGGVEETTSTNGAMTTLYRFTTEQLESGLVSLPGVVTIDTDTLVNDLSALTNYKIVATLKITERDSQVQPTQETTDFFIYTITRLKMDL